MEYKRPLLCFALPAVLAGCATAPDSYPSLAIRDAERVSGTAEPVQTVPYVPPALSGDATDRAAQLIERAEQTHNAFTLQASGLTSLAAADSGTPGSEAWAKAQVALAGLQSARAQTSGVLADLDRIYVDAATEGDATAELEPLRARVNALLAEEDATIAGLRGGNQP